MSDWLLACVAFALVAVPAYYKLRSDATNRFRSVFFWCTMIGAIIAFYTGFSAKKSQKLAQDSLKQKDVLYQKLLEKNLSNADTIIRKQNLALNSLTGQIRQNQNLLSNTKQALLEMERENNPLMNIQLKIVVVYKPPIYGFTSYGYFKSYNHSEPRYYTDSTLVDVVDSKIKLQQLKKTNHRFFDKDGNSYTYSDVVYYDFENARLEKLIIGKDTSLWKLTIYKPFSTTESDFFDKYAMGLANDTKISFYKNNIQRKPFNLNSPDLSLGFRTDSSLEIGFSEINFTEKSIREEYTLTLQKEQYNGNIRSLIDLENALMVIKWDSFMPHYESFELRYGEKFVNSIKLDPKIFSMKQIEGTPGWVVTYKFGKIIENAK